MTVDDITFSNVSKSYSGGIVALDNFSATIPSGKVTAFIGSNGSGKSTALKLLAGLIAPNTGTISFLGLNPQNKTKKLREKIGYISQDIGLDNEITGKESLDLFASLHGINGANKKIVVDNLAKEYGLKSHLKKRVKGYSGGLRQRLHIALGLIHNPKHLLLDEPTNSLDPEGKHYVWQKIKNYKSSSIIIVTHDLHEASKYCDNVVLFHNGTVLTQGHPKEIIEKNKSVQIQINFRGIIAGNANEVLNSMAGLNRLTISDGKLSLSFSQQYYNESSLYSLLTELNIEIIEIRKHEPDLSTVYFNLTGESAQNGSRHKAQRQKNRKK